MHGALLDARLLADVYLYMIGGRQPDLLGSDGPVNQLAEATEGGSLGHLWPAPYFYARGGRRSGV
jgi:DNA polymerase III epsilon subunit-like protein